MSKVADTQKMKMLAGYQLISKIGQGGMGVVYKGLHVSLNRHVAIKLLNKETTDKKSIQRFIREAKITAQLSHPNIVTLYNFECVNDTHFIVMDYIEGLSLADALARKSLSFSRTNDLMLQILSAMEHAHNQGFVHRDLKPGNVLLDREMKAFVTDFGLVKALSDESVKISRTGAIMGTPAYMAPEQAEGNPKNPVDFRSDIYSLGAIYYEMLTGRAPFQGNIYMVLQQLATEEVLPPRELNPKVPTILERICLKALAKKKTQRYQQVSEMAADLKLFQASRFDKKLSNLNTRRREKAASSPATAATRSDPLGKTVVRALPSSEKTSRSKTAARGARRPQQMQKKSSIPTWLIAISMLCCGFALSYFMNSLGQEEDTANEEREISSLVEEESASTENKEEKTQEEAILQEEAISNIEKPEELIAMSQIEAKVEETVVPKATVSEVEELFYQEILSFKKESSLKAWKKSKAFLELYSQSPLRGKIEQEKKEAEEKIARMLESSHEKMEQAIRQGQFSSAAKLLQEDTLFHNKEELEELIKEVNSLQPLYEQIQQGINEARKRQEILDTWKNFSLEEFPQLIRKRDFLEAEKQVLKLQAVLKIVTGQFSLLRKTQIEQEEKLREIEFFRDLFSRQFYDIFDELHKEGAWIGVGKTNSKTVSGTILRLDKEYLTLRKTDDLEKISFLEISAHTISSYYPFRQAPENFFFLAKLLLYENETEKAIEFFKRAAKKRYRPAIENLKRLAPKKDGSNRELDEKEESEEKIIDIEEEEFIEEEPQEDKREAKDDPESWRVPRDCFWEYLEMVKYKKRKEFAESTTKRINYSSNRLRKERDYLEKLVKNMLERDIFKRESLQGRYFGEERIAFGLEENALFYHLIFVDKKWIYDGVYVKHSFHRE